MRVPERRLQVFVSSTYTDLREERQAAVMAILRDGHIPAGMELFSADNAEQTETIREWIEESDVFVLLLGGRYGSVESDSGKSFTELEYEHAIELGKPVLSFVLSENAVTSREKVRPEIIERDRGAQIRAFRRRVLENGRMADLFETVDALDGKIGRALRGVEKNKDLVGWVRRTGAVDTTAALNQIVALTDENKKLRDMLEAARVGGATVSVPLRAKRQIRFPVFMNSGEMIEQVTTPLEWFLLCFLRMRKQDYVVDFVHLSMDILFERDLNIDRDKSNNAELVNALVGLMDEFSLFGWIDAERGQYTSKFEILPEGRAVFLQLAPT